MNHLEIDGDKNMPIAPGIDISRLSRGAQELLGTLAKKVEDSITSKLPPESPGPESVVVDMPARAFKAAVEMFNPIRMIPTTMQDAAIFLAGIKGKGKILDIADTEPFMNKVRDTARKNPGVIVDRYGNLTPFKIFTGRGLPKEDQGKPLDQLLGDWIVKRDVDIVKRSLSDKVIHEPTDSDLIFSIASLEKAGSPEQKDLAIKALTRREGLIDQYDTFYTETQKEKSTLAQLARSMNITPTKAAVTIDTKKTKFAPQLRLE